MTFTCGVLFPKLDFVPHCPLHAGLGPLSQRPGAQGAPGAEEGGAGAGTGPL